MHLDTFSVTVLLQQILKSSLSVLFSMSLGYTGARITMLAGLAEVHLGIIKTNSQSNKAAPFCKRKLYFASLGTWRLPNVNQETLMTSVRSQPLITI